jgi:glycosylphosphatidylinositol transamidase
VLIVPHGAFWNYQVDAITLEISPRIPLYKDLGQLVVLLRGGRLGIKKIFMHRIFF